jgi:hypothetical protein
MKTCADCAHGPGEQCSQLALGLTPRWPGLHGWRVTQAREVITCPRWRAQTEQEATHDRAME